MRLPMGSDVTNFSRDRVYVDQDVDDLALIARCKAGETAAYEGLVVRYQRVLFTVATRMLGDADAAADAAQNAFVKAYQKLDTFDSNRRFFSWIYRILVNECLNVRRDHTAHEPLTPSVAAVAGPDHAFETAERRGRVQAAILALPLDYREVIVLRHYTGLSYEEIGEALHVPAKTVKSRLHTAKQRLAGMLRGLENGHV
jgi:RNA polymerase sigma-70 factor (ECF subfamily)